MRVIVAGIDPSLKSTGLVLAQVDDAVFSIVDALCVDPKGRVGAERLWFIASSVASACRRQGVDDIAIEGYAFGAVSRAHSLGELGGVLRVALWRAGLRWWEVPPGTLKKFVSGSGNTKKDQMRLAAFKRWGFEHPSNDVVDAYGLARGVAAHHFGFARKSDEAAWAKATRVEARSEARAEVA